MFCFSCSQKTEYKKLELVSKGTVEIPIGDNASSTWLFLETADLEGEEYLVFQDPIRTDPELIHFAHTFDPDKSFDVPLEKEGPNGISRLDGFYVRNVDSIFVLNRYDYELTLVDTTGMVKDRFRLRADNSNSPSLETALPTIWTASPILDLGNRLIIPSSPDIDPFKVRYAQRNLVIDYDLNNRIFNYDLGFSDRYFKSGFWGTFLETPVYTVNYEDSIIVQSFPIDERVFVFDFALNLLDSYELFEDLYDGKFTSLPEFDIDRNVFYPHTFSNPATKGLIYDPHRDLYYRSMNSAYSEEAIVDIMANPRGGTGVKRVPEMSIMVFDRDFNEVGVIEIDNDQYFIEGFQVIKEGILLEKQSDSEDLVTYEIFEISS